MPPPQMMETHGYTAEEVTIDAGKANMKALALMFPIGIMMATPFYLIWKDDLSIEAVKTFAQNNQVWMTYGTLIAVVVMVAGIVLHELIHGMVWAQFCSRGFSSIRFGVLWKELTPYCHCKEQLPVKHYIIGAIMPAIMLGLVPSLLAFVTGDVFIMAFGLFFTAAAAGDFMIINLLKKENPDSLVEDHPSKIGYFIHRKKENK